MACVRDESGFSLVETLIATFILALVSAAGVLLLSSYQEGRLTMKAADERLAEVELARSILRDDLLAAQPRLTRDEYGSQPRGFQGGDQLPENRRLLFVRSGNQGALMNGTRSSLDRLEYLYEDGQLIRRHFSHTDITLETTHKDRALLTGLEGLEMRFRGQGIWGADWGADSPGPTLPRFVEITAIYPGARSLTMTFLVGARS